jgi:hypothetical protein
MRNRMKQLEDRLENLVSIAHEENVHGEDNSSTLQEINQVNDELYELQKQELQEHEAEERESFRELQEANEEYYGESYSTKLYNWIQEQAGARI